MPTSRPRVSGFDRCRSGTKTLRSPDQYAAASMAAAPYRVMLMNAVRLMTRRNVVAGAAASAALSAFPSPSRAQPAARIVVIGGGFGGASCARALRRIDAKLQVTLIEPNRTFTAC